MTRTVGTLLATLGTLLAVAAPAPAAEQLVRVDLDLPRIDIENLQRLGLDVTENVRRTYADVLLADEAQQELLRDNGFTYTVRVPDVAAADRAARVQDARVTRASELPSGRTTYRVYQDYLDEMDAIVGRAPGLARKVTMPRKTVEGRDIVGVEISEQVGRVDDGKPVYVVMGVHHAREWPSAEMNIEFANELVDRFGSDPRFTALVKRARVFVFPIINVDAFLVSRDGIESNRRKSCAPLNALEESLDCADRTGVDLNRNYGAYWGGEGASALPSSDTWRGPGPWSEPETTAVHEFSQRLQITNFQTIHNVAALVLRPPGFEQLGLAPDEDRLKELGDAMGAATGYASEYGYELYPVTGATEDWNYVAQGAFAYTIETGPSSGSFQGAYQTHVVEQYDGKEGTATQDKGVREALLLAGEQAVAVADHAILTGEAPAGATLRLRKDFQTTTSEVCAATLPLQDACVPGSQGEAMLLDDYLDTTLVVPESGRFGWHVNPSTRPFVKKEGGSEAWTLTCEQPAGTVVATKQVAVDRGEVVVVDPCGPDAPAAAVANDRPLARTLAPSGVGLTAATLRGLVNGLGRVASYRFEYGPTDAYGTQTDLVALDDEGAAAFAERSASIGGLSPSTTYHYRVVARRGDGTVVEGGDRTFTTAAVQPAPTAVTDAASGVTPDGAVLAATVNPLGAATTVRFEYGPTTDYGTTTAAQDVGAGTAPVQRTRALTGLAPATTYHYRVIAQNAAGTTLGADRTFTTAPEPVDEETTATTGTTSTSAATTGGPATVPPPTATGATPSAGPAAATLPAFAFSAAVDRQRLRSVLGARGLLARTRCSLPCRLRATVTVSAADARRLKLARRTIAATTRGTTSGRRVIRLRPSAPVRRRLAAARGLRVAVTLVATDARGRSVRRVVMARLT